MILNIDTVLLVNPVPLPQAPQDADCFVVGVEGDGVLLSRLREMGIEIGGHLRVLRSGRSMLLNVGDTRLALRAPEAAAVQVCPAG